MNNKPLLIKPQDSEEQPKRRTIKLGSKDDEEKAEKMEDSSDYSFDEEELN